MDFISKIARPHCKWTASRFFFLITAFMLAGCAAPAPKVTYRQPPVVAPAEQTLPSTPSLVQPPVDQETVAPSSAEHTLEGEPYSVSPVAITAATDDLTSSVHTIDYIEQRLTTYEKKFQQWLDLHPQDYTDANQWSALTSNSCLDKFNALLSSYTNLRNRLQSTIFSVDMPKPQNAIQEILQLDIAFLESDCEQRLSRPAPRPAHDYSQGIDPVLEARDAEKTINTSFNEEQYDQVIAVFQLFTKTYPTITPSLQTLKQYGLAQLHGNDIDEATDAFSQALAVADNAIWIKQDIENQLRQWTDKQLRQVAVLTGKKEFQQALALLAEIPPGHLPADLQERLQQATVAVKTAELQGHATQRIQLEESLASQWKSSNNLLDSQQYDSAIAGFTPLLNTSYDAKARKNIQEAANLAAAAQRKQAATLFIKAVKARSPKNKEELLLESRQILQEVLKKYPHADIIDKVAQNLTTIEEHIQQFDPTLLEETELDPFPDSFADKMKAPDQIQDHGLNDAM